MIRSLVGRGVRRVKGRSAAGGSAARTAAGPVASWTPSAKTAPAPAPSEPAAASASAVLDWVEEAAAVEPAPAPEPVAAPAATGGSTFAAIAARAAQGGLGKAVHADAASTNLAAYKARAAANGREVDLAGEGLNLSDDGVPFWGPVDNESSRAKAKGLALTIDQHECISCGTCEENTDQVFLLPEAPPGQEEDKAEVLRQEGPMDLIQDAIDACPVTCIEWIPPDELQPTHSAGGFAGDDKPASV